MRKPTDKASPSSSFDLTLFLEITPDVLGILDSDNNFVFASFNWEKKLGYSAEELIGKNFLDYVVDSDRDLTERFLKKLRHSKQLPVYTNCMIGKDSKHNRWFSWTASFGEEDHTYIIGEDITRRKRLEENLHDQAYVDSLTGLLNRSAFNKSLERFIARGNRYHQYFALAFIDLNKFKIINDTLGHAVGDELLQTVSKRLRTAKREGDVVGRLGGDEFVVILAGADQRQEYEDAIERMITEVQKPFIAGDKNLEPQMSIGIARFPICGTDSKTLLQKADEAMYQAKKRSQSYSFAEPMEKSPEQ